MHIELIGGRVRLTFPDSRALMLSAQEALDLMDWIRARELDIQIKAMEADIRERQVRERQEEEGNKPE